MTHKIVIHEIPAFRDAEKLAKEIANEFGFTVDIIGDQSVTITPDVDAPAPIDQEPDESIPAPDESIAPPVTEAAPVEVPSEETAAA